MKDTLSPKKVASKPFMHHACEDDLTEPHGMMLDALRIWERAQTNPKLRKELLTWDEIQLCTGMSKKQLADFTEGWSPLRKKRFAEAVIACKKIIKLNESLRKLSEIAAR
jgi:hypothetical protein